VQQGSLDGKDNEAKAIEYIKKAYELSDRVSHKEKLMIQANYYTYAEKDEGKQLETLKKILEDYPDDIFANATLGVFYFQREDWDKAIQYVGTVVEIYGEFIFNYYRLGSAYDAKGLYSKAREVYRGYIQKISDNARVRGYLSSSFAYEGDYEQALKEADKAISLDPRSFWKGQIYHLQGDYSLAEKDYKRWLEDDSNNVKFKARQWLEILYWNRGQYVKAREQAEKGLELAKEVGNNSWKRTFHFALGFNHWSSGNYEEAMNEAEKVWAIAVEDQSEGSMKNAIYLKAMAYLEQGQINEAQTAAEEMKKIIEGMINPKLIRDYYTLQGLIELKKKDYSKAIDYIERGYAMFPKQRDWLEAHAFYVYFLGLAHFLSGNLDKADEAFDDIVNMTTGRLFWGDLWAKSFYMLGKIHEQQGNTTKAIEHYGKFLDLWKNADPGIAEVEDAKNRLAKLRQ
jgi:tetratricopeptide (TPR) repeat protein